MHWRGQEVRTAWLDLHHPSPKATQLKVRRDLSLWFLSWGKVRACAWAPGLPRCWRSSFLSHPIQSTELWTAWPGGWEETGRVADRTQGMEDIQSLLTALWTLPRSRPTKYRERLTCRSPQLAHSTPQCSACLTHTPDPVAGALCVPSMAVTRARSGRQIVSTHRSLSQVCRPGKGHKLKP